MSWFLTCRAYARSPRRARRAGGVHILRGGCHRRQHVAASDRWRERVGLLRFDDRETRHRRSGPCPQVVTAQEKQGASAWSPVAHHIAGCRSEGQSERHDATVDPRSAVRPRRRAVAQPTGRRRHEQDEGLELFRHQAHAVKDRSSIHPFSGCDYQTVGPDHRHQHARALRAGEAGHHPTVVGPFRRAPEGRRSAGRRVAHCRRQRRGTSLKLVTDGLPFPVAGARTVEHPYRASRLPNSPIHTRPSGSTPSVAGPPGRTRTRVTARPRDHFRHQRK